MYHLVADVPERLAGPYYATYTPMLLPSITNTTAHSPTSHEAWTQELHNDCMLLHAFADLACLVTPKKESHMQQLGCQVGSTTTNILPACIVLN